MNKFWESKSLHDLNNQEWEALCDRCGLCCLHKLIDEDNEDIYYTRVACRLLDLRIALCKNYNNRKREVSHCVKLNKNNIQEFVSWLPETCAYKLRYNNKSLPSSHHLNQVASSHEYTKSDSATYNLNLCINENNIKERIEHYIISIEDLKKLIK